MFLFGIILLGAIGAAVFYRHLYLIESQANYDKEREKETMKW